jgi:hypothetical protein
MNSRDYLEVHRLWATILYEYEEFIPEDVFCGILSRVSNEYGVIFMLENTQRPGNSELSPEDKHAERQWEKIVEDQDLRFDRSNSERSKGAAPNSSLLTRGGGALTDALDTAVIDMLEDACDLLTIILRHKKSLDYNLALEKAQEALFAMYLGRDGGDPRDA